MRILTLNYEFPPLGGGSSPMSYELGRELVALGHEVDVITMGYGGLPAREQIDGIGVHRVPCIRKRPDVCQTHEMVSYVLGAVPSVARLIRTHRYDVNHTHFIVPTGLLARLVKLRTGLPFVVTVHGSDVPGYNPDRFTLQHRMLGPLWRWILKGTDHLISPSHFLGQLVGRQSCGRPCTVIPNGFRYERFRADPPKERRILVVTRMIPRKGVQYLLEALPGLNLDGFEVDIVGDGPHLPVLQRLAAERVPPVKFWGWLDNDSAELKRLYERSAIFVLTSEAENFPTALLEAMASGQAIVTAAGTGCPEVVGEDALLVAPRDPGQLRQALQRLIQDDQLRTELGQRARARVEREFGWRRIARRYVELYRQAAPSEQAASRALSWRPAVPAQGTRSAAPYQPTRETAVLRDIG